MRLMQVKSSLKPTSSSSRTSCHHAYLSSALPEGMTPADKALQQTSLVSRFCYRVRLAFLSLLLINGCHHFLPWPVSESSESVPLENLFITASLHFVLFKSTSTFPLPSVWSPSYHPLVYRNPDLITGSFSLRLWRREVNATRFFHKHS